MDKSITLYVVNGPLYQVSFILYLKPNLVIRSNNTILIIEQIIITFIYNFIITILTLNSI